ncbi:MAG: hypothetical protein RIT20_154, partial [Pseudomonadota bacterium]
MNKVYRVIFNEVTATWTVVAEIARSCGKRSSLVKKMAKLAAVMGLASQMELAAAGPPAPTELPTQGQVAAGIARIGREGTASAPVLNIDQSSQRAVINWGTFNVGSSGTVNFNQPNAQAATLNRVRDANPSQIFGKVNAPGQVTFINPAGVYFGKSAVLDVGAVTATTMNQSDAQFMAGKSEFARNGAAGAVVNEGTIRAALGGYVALLAPQVRNEGLIVAQQGTVVMAGAEAVKLNFDPASKLASITVSPSLIATLIENKTAVQAPEGLIILSATALDAMTGQIINSGQLNASSLTRQGGRILLQSGKVQLSATSVLQAKGPTQGGEVHIQAQRIENAGAIDVSSTQGAGGKVLLQASSAGVPTPVPTTLGTASTSASVTTAQTAIALEPQSQVRADGAVRGGEIRLESAQAVKLENAALSASSVAGTGGTVVIESRELSVTHSTVSVDGDARGGQVQLRATPGEQVTSSDPLSPLSPMPGGTSVMISGTSVVSASSRRGRGGDVSVTGTTLILQDTTRIDATGATGGGEVYVGGGWQGTGPLPHATTVTMGPEVVIDASALEQGQGGTVVLWSDVRNPFSLTSAHGTILAKGGTQGGDGGQIETSGGRLQVDGVTGSAAAPMGKAGEWLFDPTNITIGSSGSANSGNDGSSISATGINNLLNGGTSVTVTTFSGGGDLGNLTVSEAINKSSGNGDVTLTLRAANTIVISRDIAHTGGSGRLHLVIDADNNTAASTANASPSRDGAGIVILEANLSTGGGNLLVGGVTQNGSTGGDLFIGGSSALSISTAGGSVDVKGNLIIANSSADGVSINTAGGAIDLRGAVDSGNQYTAVAGAKTWQQAFDDAKTRSNSWLATIGSSLENALAVRAANTSSAWLGGQRIHGTNEWRWTADPSYNATTKPLVFFFQGATTETSLGSGSSGSGGTTATGYFANWSGWTNGVASGEPNNWNGGAATFSIEGESALQFTGSQGKWNDLPRASTTLDQYVLETNLAPSRLNLNAGTGAVRISNAVGFSKALSQLDITASSTTLSGRGVITTGAQNYSSGFSAENSGRIEISGATISSSGAVSIKSLTNDVFLNATFTHIAPTASTFNVEAQRHIQLGTNASISSTTAALQTTLWADTDKSGDGIIYFEGSGINTKGGALTFGKAGQTNVLGGATVMVGGDVFFQRSSAQTLSTEGGAINIYGETIVSNTSGLNVNSGNGDVTLHGMLNSGNQYSGVQVATAISWTAARDAAKGATGGASALGDSYLATITSRLENSIAALSVNNNSSWLGARQLSSNGAWQWNVGPEIGQALTYTNWNPGEPNNCCTGTANGAGFFGENALQFTGANSSWNDLFDNGVFSSNLNFYVRETNLAASPVTFNAGTGTLTLKSNVGSSKAISTLAVTAVTSVINSNSMNTSVAQNYTGNLTVNTGSGDFLVRGGALNVSGNATFNAGRVLQQTSLNATGSGSLTFNSPLVANADNLSITSGSGGVTFNSTLNSDAASTLRNLTVTATGGDVTLNATVGGTLRLDNLLINANNLVVPNANLSVSVAEDLVLNAGLKHAGASDVTTTLTAGDDIFLNGAVSTSSSGKLNLSLTGARYGGVIAFEGDVSTGGGNLTATAETISFQATSNQTVNTSASSGTGGAIDFSNVSSTDTQVVLGVLNSGSAGTLTLSTGGGAVNIRGSVDSASSVQRQTDIGTGLTGWSSTATHATGYGDWGSVVGPFANGNAGVTRTLDFGNQGKNITFDFYRLESWDNEFLRLYVNGSKVGERSFVENGILTGTELGTSVTSGYALRFSPSGGVLSGDYNTTRGWNDQKVAVNLDTPALGSFTFRVDSSLDSVWNDEGWGIKNLLVRNLASSYSGAAALTVNAGAGAIGLTSGVGQSKTLAAMQLNSTGATTLGGAVRATSVTTNTGGTLQLNGASVTTTGAQTYGENISLGRAVTLTASDISSAGTLNLGANTLTLNTPSDMTIAGVISGTGGAVTKQGAGTLTLSGANTFTGGMTISQGTMKAGVSSVGSTSGAMGTGTVTVQSGSVVDLNGMTVANALNISGTGIGNTGVLINSSTTAATASGTVTVAANATLGGTGAMTLSGAVGAGSNTVTFANASGFTATHTSNSIQNIAISNTALTLKTNQALSVAASSLSGNTTLQTVAADKDITVSGAITNNLNDNSLTLMAARDIVFSSSVSGASGKSLNVSAYGDTDNSNAGGIRFGSFISTWGGHVVLAGGTTDTTAGCAGTFSCTGGYASKGISN